MNFKDWLKLDEVGTTTASVAVFKEPIGIGMVVRRTWPFLDQEDKKKKKKKLD
jgi:hypothetical protein